MNPTHFRPSRTLAALIAGVFALTALAGCTGGAPSDAASSSSAPATAPDPVVTAQKGAVTGLVTDEEGLPIVGAQLTVVELKDRPTVLSDAEGRFTMSDIDPGAYQVAAYKLGYNSVVQLVQVIAGEVATANFVLKAVPPPVEALVVLTEHRGYLQCSLNAQYVLNQCGDLLGGDKNRFKFEVATNRTFQEVVIELVWTPATPATGQELELDLCKDDPNAASGVNCFAQADLVGNGYRHYTSGRSPQILRYGDLPVARDVLKYVIEVGSGYALDSTVPYVLPAVQQAFTVYLSLCYVEKCAPEYTAIPGAA